MLASLDQRLTRTLTFTLSKKKARTLTSITKDKEELGMGVLPTTFSDVVIALDCSAALSGVFPALLNNYIIPLIE